MIGIGAVVVAFAVGVGAVVTGIVGPKLRRRHPGRGRRQLGDSSGIARGPVEAKRNAGPSYFTSPGA